MFFIGLTYVDPPEEYGVAINFGTADVGSGPPVLNKTIKSTPKVAEVTEEVKAVKKTVVEDDLTTQDVEEAPIVKKEFKSKVKEIRKEEVKSLNKDVSKPNKETQNALNNLFGKKSNGQTAVSEGGDVASGVKGSLDGEANANKYYGENGFGGLGNYALKGRKVQSKPKRKPNCNEEGIVVVRVEVNNIGKVIKATPGVKGTTNQNPCLLKPAKEAAMLTQWNGDNNAPTKQVGYIRYQFTLSE